MDAVTYAILKKLVGSILPGYSYKGSVASVEDLPVSGTTGDLYTVAGVQYVWDGTQWVEVSGPISNADIDALFT